jgi:hypothetical protein
VGHGEVGVVGRRREVEDGVGTGSGGRVEDGDGRDDGGGGGNRARVGLTGSSRSMAEKR